MRGCCFLHHLVMFPTATREILRVILYDFLKSNIGCFSSDSGQSQNIRVKSPIRPQPLQHVYGEPPNFNAIRGVLVKSHSDFFSFFFFFADFILFFSFCFHQLITDIWIWIWKDTGVPAFVTVVQNRSTII